MKKFFVTGIPNHTGRYRVYNVTKEDRDSYLLHLNDGVVPTGMDAGILNLKTDGGNQTSVYSMFMHFENEMMSKMSDAEKAKYLLVNR